MKLKYTFEYLELDDYIIAVPVGDTSNKFHSVIKMNKSALEILELFNKDVTVEDVISKLKKKYGNDETIELYVNESIGYLMKEGVLE